MASYLPYYYFSTCTECSLTFFRMAKCKFCLGRQPKRYDQAKKKRSIGRPRKTTVSSLSSSSSSESSHDVSDLTSYSASNELSMSRDTTLNLDSPDSVHPVESEDDWIQVLSKGLVLPGEHWTVKTVNPGTLGLHKISCHPNQSLVVTYSIVITSNFEWTLTVYGKKVYS